MKKKLKNIVVITILAVIVITIPAVFVFHSINSNKEEKNLPKTFDYGKIDNGTYYNDFFNFVYTYPPGWSTLDKKEMEAKVKDKIEISFKDEELKSKINADMVDVPTLFYAIKKPTDTNAEFTPSILINCENISKYNGSLSFEAYAEQAKKMMEQTKMAVSFSREEMKTIGGKDFLKLTIENNNYGITIKQEYFITIINDFTFNIVVSYMTDESKTIIANSLNTIKFY